MASKPPFQAYLPAIPLDQASIPRAWLYVSILATMASYYAWVARYLYLDDSFIHLRIAKNLLDHGFYSFNGDAPAYCTSSPLFTALLALCCRLISTPNLPKILGVLIYAVLFALISRRVATAVTDYSRSAWIVFLAAVASPLAMRWLVDGMETGLVGVFALLLARAAFEIYSNARRSVAGALIRFTILGFVASTLRIEFSLLVALIAAAALTRVRVRGMDRRAIALAVGSAAGLALIYALFGRILPDTAIAKAHATSDISMAAAALTTLLDTAKAHAAASSLGVMVILGVTVSFLSAIRSARDRYFVAALNAGLVVLILLVMFRQQAIQGYRYFVFIEFFLFAFNIAVLDVPRTARDKASVAALPWKGIKSPVLAIALGVAFVSWQAFDLYKLRTITAGRAISYDKFASIDLKDLGGTYGIAWDVGMIGYFSQATILDADGLVDGIHVARMTQAERLRSFVTTQPVRFVYADALQLAVLRDYIDVSGWDVRETFDFPNFAGDPDRHFLLVRRN